jgi:hypothetical protein
MSSLDKFDVNNNKNITSNTTEELITEQLIFCKGIRRQHLNNKRQ